MAMADDTAETLLALTADIVTAHVSNNSVALNDMPGLIARVHDALAGLRSEPEAASVDPQKPAVSVRSSIKPDHLVCLEDGKKMKMLKRHLTTDHGMTAAEYRAKWNLPGDYPMVAPAYAEVRRNLAIASGLGRKTADAKPRRGGTPKSRA
ncbi:MucR family transcriptional regulator [Sphingomonas koreensis]